ncbi:MAG: 6-phosphogluconolactonase [bacterium]|nr:6-phosphogluconolactonase [bacterium]
MRDIIICETPDDVADAAADLIFESQTQAVAARGAYRVALCGGATPRLLYERLASDEWREVMNWPEWEVFWSDERAVSPEHTDSHYRLAYDALLREVAVQNVWRMRAEAAALGEAADEYARTLRSRLGPGFPVFDTILLGMGSDGHTASLFPGHRVLDSSALVEAVEDMTPRRLTLTLPVLNGARQVIFLVTGAEKAERVRDVLEHNDPRFPAAQVLPEEGTCTWILDHEAARLIR